MHEQEVKAPVRDMVNHPSHYTNGEIECIEAIKASMSKDEFLGYLKGNAMKYVWRYRLKGKPREDLEKANFYLNRLHDEIAKEKTLEEWVKENM